MWRINTFVLPTKLFGVNKWWKHRNNARRHMRDTADQHEILALSLAQSASAERMEEGSDENRASRIAVRGCMYNVALARDPQLLSSTKSVAQAQSCQLPPWKLKEGSLFIVSMRGTTQFFCLLLASIAKLIGIDKHNQHGADCKTPSQRINDLLVPPITH